MSVIGSNILAGASGAAGGGSKVYVDDVFSTFLYEGNGGAQSINNGIDLAGEGGLVWIKNRSNGGSYTNHAIVDSEREGSSGYKSIYSNMTQGQFDPSNAASAVVTAFNSNGFTTGGNANISNSGGEYVSWTFRKAPGWLDIVTFNGTGSAQTLSHQLGSAPGMIIVKNLTIGSNWIVYHRSTGATKKLELNEPGSAGTNSGAWNDTEPTSLVFTVGTNNSGVDGSGNGYNYVAYLFAHDDAQFGTDGDESIIKCGTYPGTNTGGLQTVNVGFEPQFVLIKRSNGSANWQIIDAMRGAADNGIDQALLAANLANGENTEGIRLFVTNDGFGWRDQTGNNVSGTGNTFIYMAIRRPHKPPEAATEVFAIDYGDDSSTIPCFNSAFPVDFAIRCSPALNGNDHRALSRPQGTRALFTSSTADESTDNDTVWDSMAGYGKGINNNFLSYMFKRAPGFMDVVAYNSVSGGNVSNSQNHNLGVAPEMIIVKKRDALSGWPVYHSAVGLSRSARLNSTSMDENASGYWESAPTSTQFFPYGSDVNNAGTWMAYLFATLPNISKVGSYSGDTGNNVDVDYCGFIAGARFILIKRTDTGSTGDWYVWDTTRGINPVGTNSGYDPYFLLNSAVPQVTNTNYINPLTTGFTVTSSAPAALNATGGTYIFLAIA